MRTVVKHTNSPNQHTGVLIHFSTKLYHWLIKIISHRVFHWGSLLLIFGFIWQIDTLVNILTANFDDVISLVQYDVTPTVAVLRFALLISLFCCRVFLGVYHFYFILAGNPHRSRDL